MLLSSSYARQEVAQRLSFDWSESVTIGRAMADWLALRKGEYLGVMEADETAERVAREETDDLPTRTVEMMARTCCSNSVIVEYAKVGERVHSSMY